jgi:TonB family protein
MHIRLPALHRATLALAVSAAWLAGSPAAGQRRAATEEVPIVMSTMADLHEYERLRVELFPPAAREAGHTWGSATVKFRVRMDSTADPASIVVEKSSDPLFDEPAKAFVRQMRWVPATIGGRPVEAWIRQPVGFQASRVSSGGTFRVGYRDEPVLLNGGDLRQLIADAYPAALRDAGVTGSVLLRFRIDERGAVEPNWIMVELTTDPAFEAPAAAVARGLRFSSATSMSGASTFAWVTMPIHFGRVVPQR